jgi:hypothetical protein
MGILLNGSTDIMMLRQFTGATSAMVISDDQINYFITSEESLVLKKIGMTFVDTIADEMYDGLGDKTLVLNNYPLRSVSMLEVDGSSVLQSNYYVYTDKCKLVLKNGYFSSNNPQNVHVIYTYGVPSAQDPITFELAKQIAFKEVAKKIFLQTGNADSHGIQSEKLGTYSIDFGTKGPYGDTIKGLNDEIQKAYDALGIKVEMRII